MKKIICLLLSCLVFNSAYAGLPSKDPSVAAIREVFKSSRMPVEADLKFGKKWYCRYFNATNSSWPHSTDIKGLTMEKLDHYMYYFVEAYPGVFVPSLELNSLVFSTTVFDINQYRYMSRYDFLRVTQHNELTLEITFDPKDINGWDIQSEVSLSKPELNVVWYLVCSTVKP